MRDAYHDDLESITEKLVQMSTLVGGMIGRATTALLDADLDLAERVITWDDQVDEVYAEVEQLAYDVMARQQPVAGDLRLIVTSLRMVADLERMGDYAMHVAKLARRRYPASAIPPELRSIILEMGQAAQRIVEKVGSVVASRDVSTALELEQDDDVIDAYQRRLFLLLLEGKRPYPTEVAIDVTLCGRYYERFCDHAVSVARRVVYLVTGRRAREVAGGISTA
ncbi:MAG: phosphate signaling complex protein PhoU [Frankiaceae bacterium]